MLMYHWCMYELRGEGAGRHALSVMDALQCNRGALTSSHPIGSMLAALSRAAVPVQAAVQRVAASSSRHRLVARRMIRSCSPPCPPALNPASLDHLVHAVLARIVVALRLPGSDTSVETHTQGMGCV